uniref:Ammonium_transp domain-containing protein n=1 Tax=Bursaphelenchus xylophilus TaxID=6326 RepID=A0A1I7RUH4_BURXY
MILNTKLVQSGDLCKFFLSCLAGKEDQLLTFTEPYLQYPEKTLFSDTILCVLALCGMIASLVIAGVKGQTIDHEGLQGENLWITAVWFWMTFKWTMMSAIYTRKYARNTDGYTVEQDF